MRIRLTTRKILALSTLIALAYGVHRELEDSRVRDNAAASEAYLRGNVAFHVQQAAYCRGQASSAPYDKNARFDAITKGVGYSLNMVNSWSEEAALHDYWAWARGQFADECREEKRTYERRLLWSF